MTSGSTINLFTPAPGTTFVFDGVITMKALRYEGDILMCAGLNGRDDQRVYAISAEDRADLLQFLVLQEVN